MAWIKLSVIFRQFVRTDGKESEKHQRSGKF